MFSCWPQKTATTLAENCFVGLKPRLKKYPASSRVKVFRKKNPLHRVGIALIGVTEMVKAIYAAISPRARVE